MTQTAQQHGTGAKTIIILQSQNPPLTTQSVAAATNQQPKIMMQKMTGGNIPSPVVTVTSSPVIVSTSLPNTIKSMQPPIMSTSTVMAAAPGGLPASAQFISSQSAAAGAQTLPSINATTLPAQITNMFSLGTTNVTQTAAVATVVNQAAQTPIAMEVASAAGQVGGIVMSQQPQQQQQQTVATVSCKSSPNVMTMTATGVTQQQLQTVAAAGALTPQSRQVKVIKTVPHLQPATPNKLQQQQQQVVVTQQQAIAAGTAGATVVTTSSLVAVQTVAVTSATATTTVITPSTQAKPTEQQGQFLCEWRSCMR